MSRSLEESLELAAQIVRVRLQVDDQDIPDMATLIFKLKNEGMIADYERVPDKEMPDDEAEYDSIKRILRLRESTFLAANDPYRGRGHRRARFTIGHEIGHVYRDHKFTRHRNISARVIEHAVRQIRIDEFEANWFSGALLIPRYRVDIALNPTPEEIAERFCVTRVAAAVRLDQLQRMHRRENGLKRELPETVRTYLQEAKNKGASIRSLDNKKSD